LWVRCARSRHGRRCGGGVGGGARRSAAARFRRRLALPPAALPESSFAQAARAHWFAHTDQIKPLTAAATAAPTAARTAAGHAALAVVSANYSDIVRHGLTVVGLDDLSWTIVGRDDVARAKPAPTPTCTPPDC
jgi:beta-phosphoglucomutase-like phosphatase (HAD superfamily)